MSARDVVITGIGLVSSLGEGTETHWNALSGPNLAPIVDSDRFSPYSVHPLPQIDWSLQIPKRGDQRQMETWQRLGTYTAGLALDDAGMKGNDALCSTMDMVVAAGGGERDEVVDEMILAASESRTDLGTLVNEKLTTELRPTLFLAQLSNLLAGNISIVHKVTGSSRTFMGEEGAGVSAVETAVSRIRSGQSTHALIGGAYHTEHPDMLLAYELGAYLHRGQWKPVWQRGGSEGGGVVTGSGAAFLVLESREHAERRGQRIYASIGPVVSGRARRDQGKLGDAISHSIDALAADEDGILALSGASGAHGATVAELAALSGNPAVAARGFGSFTGHMKEAQFPFAIALAALAVSNASAYPPFDKENERPFKGVPTKVVATAIGYHRFEGLALITAA